MEITLTLAFVVTIIVDYIDVSLQFDCLPNGEPIPGVSVRKSPVSSDRDINLGRPPPGTRHSPPAIPSPPAMTPSPAMPPLPAILPPPAVLASPAMPCSTAMSSPATIPLNSSSKNPAKTLSPTDTTFHARSESIRARITDIPTKIDGFDGLQYELDRLEHIRLTPYKNPSRVFQLRRYTLPKDKRILLLHGMNLFDRIPREKQIVLSTTNNEVYAILQTSNILAGMYSHIGRPGGRGRVKIYMESGKVSQMTKDEIDECPVGRNSKILRNFRVDYDNHHLPEK